MGHIPSTIRKSAPSMRSKSTPSSTRFQSLFPPQPSTPKSTPNTSPSQSRRSSLTPTKSSMTPTSDLPTLNKLLRRLKLSSSHLTTSTLSQSQNPHTTHMPTPTEELSLL